jgi:hypothetical protein
VLLTKVITAKCATSECCHGFDSRLKETIGGNPNGVLNSFRIGEREEARPAGEEMANTMALHPDPPHAPSCMKPQMPC